MNSKIYIEADYPVVADWWTENNCPTPHSTQLQTLGVIGYADGEPACAGWAYMSKGVPVAFLDHFITNPDITSPMKKMRAVVSMMETILDELSEDGYQLIRATTWSETLGRVCHKRWGFQVVDDGATNLSLLLP